LASNTSESWVQQFVLHPDCHVKISEDLHKATIFNNNNSLTIAQYGQQELAVTSAMYSESFMNKVDSIKILSRGVGQTVNLVTFIDYQKYFIDDSYVVDMNHLCTQITNGTSKENLIYPSYLESIWHFKFDSDAFVSDDLTRIKEMSSYEQYGNYLVDTLSGHAYLSTVDANLLKISNLTGHCPVPFRAVLAKISGKINLETIQGKPSVIMNIIFFNINGSRIDLHKRNVFVSTGENVINESFDIPSNAEYLQIAFRLHNFSAEILVGQFYIKFL
jgi:hypothetical protein